MIELPKGLQQIGDEAFRGCSGFNWQVMRIPRDCRVGRMGLMDCFLDRVETYPTEFREDTTPEEVSG